jgi:hypothetical protein
LPQQRVQIGELAALALMAHPHAFLRIPAPRAVEQEEQVACRPGGRRSPYLALSASMLAAAVQQRASLGQRGLRRVEQVGQQRRMQAGVAIGQEAHLQRLDQRIDARCAAQHGRHHDQRARFGGMPREKSMRGSGGGTTSQVAAS